MATEHFDLPIPEEGLDPLENINEALLKVRAALIAVDGILHTQAGAVAGKAALEHAHAIADITGLTGALAAKMAADATFSLDGLTDTAGVAEAPEGYLLGFISGYWSPMSPAAALGEHGHTIAEITGLAAALASFQAREDRVGVLEDYSGIILPAGYVWPAGQNLSRTTYATLWARTHTEATVTMTIASPAVVSWTAHGLKAGDPVRFYTTGALPTGVTANTTYYVIAAGLTADSFRFSATLGGSAVNTSGAQSGVHTAVHAPHGYGDGSTTFGVVDARERVIVGRGDMGGTAANRFSTSGSGINGTLLGTVGGSETHTLTTTQLPAHNHGVTDPQHYHAIYDPGHYHQQTGGNAYPAGADYSAANTLNHMYTGNTASAVTGVSMYNAATGISIQNAGSGAAHNNVQPTLVLNKILYTGVY